MPHQAPISPALRLSAYVAAGSGALTLIALWVWGVSTTGAAATAGVAALGAGVLHYFLIRHFLLRPVNRVTAEILETLRNERFREKILDSHESEIVKLSRSVRRLIHDKSTEIGHLKELERLRREFLGDVAHELRSPIFNIQGYLDTLLEGALQDEEVATRFLNKAAKHADHLSSLVEDLVTISRIEAGELILDQSEFDIKELMAEVAELLEVNARAKNIRLECEFLPEPPCVVFADRGKIRQVLFNLLGNSIKYGRADGRTGMQLEVNAAAGQAVIKIIDNGEGIAEEHLPRVFERFYRADKSRSRDVPSTGLGLAIVKHFMEAHGQSVSVTSREKVGSIFSFTIALAGAPR